MAKPIVKFRIDFGPEESIGPGKIALLERIEGSGSISKAARALGMSYSRGWQLLDSLNESFREPLATASKGGRGGGGATLTPLGREVIRTYRAFETEVQDRAALHFSPLSRRVRAAAERSKAAPVIRMCDR
jgi:molybdate transport system regulatory protein